MKLLTYADKDTPIHRLTGVTKLLFFLGWSITGMLTYDTRVLAFMLLASLLLFRWSKTEYRQVATVFKIVLFFLLLNVLAIFFFSPYEGTRIYGTKTELWPLFGNYSLTSEQLFYELNVILKYLTVVPIALIFLVTTDPSEFASSLNQVGLTYGISYSVALTLRYIPDVQKDFSEIRQAQEARGIDMSAKAPIGRRIKHMAAILFPLIFLSMERINRISNAMELRGFGKHKKRTWYRAKSFSWQDKAVLVGLFVFMVGALFLTFHDGNRFYNPFI